MDLRGELVLHDFLPHLAAFTILVRAVLKPGKLLAALSDKRVEAEQFCFKFGCLPWCAFHITTCLHHKPGALGCHPRKR